jgi:hypothetical protein
VRNVCEAPPGTYRDAMTTSACPRTAHRSRRVTHGDFADAKPASSDRLRRDVHLLDDGAEGREQQLQVPRLVEGGNHDGQLGRGHSGVFRL